MSLKVGSYSRNLGEILRAKKDQFSIVNPVAMYEAQLTLASHLLSKKQFSAGLHGELEHELNLHGEIFHPYAKLPIARISIAMNGICPQKNARRNGKCDRTFSPVRAWKAMDRAVCINYFFTHTKTAEVSGFVQTSVL